jgi:hypothetical protein
MTIFFRLLDVAAEEKAHVLGKLCEQCRSLPGSDSPAGTRLFTRSLDSLSAIPRSPYAYWASDAVVALFKDLAHGPGVVRECPV